MKTKTSTHKKPHILKIYGKTLQKLDASQPIKKANEKVTPKSYYSTIYIRPTGSVKNAWKIVGYELSKAMKEFEHEAKLNNGVTLKVTGAESGERK